jgi:hypothetical protein
MRSAALRVRWFVSHDHHFVESVGADSIIDMGKELDAGEELKDITA